MLSSLSKDFNLCSVLKGDIVNAPFMGTKAGSRASQ